MTNEEMNKIIHEARGKCWHDEIVEVEYPHDRENEEVYLKNDGEENEWWYSSDDIPSWV